MNIVGTGLSGLVGSKFVELYSNKYSISNLDLTAGVDITKEDDVMRAVEASNSPALIHLAAFTDVNKAFEQTGDKDGVCYKVNVTGTQNIANACKKTGKHLVHVSTAFVFDGKSDKDRKPIYKTKNFFIGVMGRVAHLEGGNYSSLYAHFNTDEGNQIDHFLREIGYSVDKLLPP